MGQAMINARGVMVTAERIVFLAMGVAITGVFRVMELGEKNARHVLGVEQITMVTGVHGVGVMDIKNVQTVPAMEIHNVFLAVGEVIKIALGVGAEVIMIALNVMVPDRWSVKLATVMGK